MIFGSIFVYEAQASLFICSLADIVFKFKFDRWKGIALVRCPGGQPGLQIL